MPTLKQSTSLKTILAAGLLTALSACNGLLSPVYDDDPGETEETFGFVKIAEGDTPGMLYIDATDYKHWNYIDFHSNTITTLPVDQDPPADLAWDIALHRYDVKTNQGAALQTAFKSIGSLIGYGRMPQGNYTEDVVADSVVIADISRMTEGIIEYITTQYNPVVSLWLNYDLMTMPPIYHYVDDVFVVRLRDNTHLALHLDSYTNDKGTKGYMHISYMYPLQLP